MPLLVFMTLLSKVLFVVVLLLILVPFLFCWAVRGFSLTCAGLGDDEVVSSSSPFLCVKVCRPISGCAHSFVNLITISRCDYVVVLCSYGSFIAAHLCRVIFTWKLTFPLYKKKGLSKKKCFDLFFVFARCVTLRRLLLHIKQGQDAIVRAQERKFRFVSASVLRF